MRELKTEVLIVGGSVGGCAAALAIAEAGRRVVMTEETDWIGGQLTAQAVPPDEHGWIECFGCTASYRKFRDGVRNYYRRHYPLTEAARAKRFLNPGNGWVSPLCCEPRVALAVLEAMLAPHVGSGRLTILRKHEIVRADMKSGDVIRAVKLRDLRRGRELTITADYFLDATDLGDLLSHAGTEFVTGTESRAETNEPSAPAEADPENVQAFSACFAVDHIEGEDHTIERPERYDFWCEFVPDLRPAWSGRLLSLTGVNPRTLEPVRYNFAPHREPPVAFSGLWNYRRILDRDNFIAGKFASDISLINVPMIDYMLGDLTSGTAIEREHAIASAKEQSLSFLYWLQTEAERPDGGEGWKGLRLRKDVVGTSDGLAKSPYIRESRRIKAAFTVCEQHIAARARPNANRAEDFADSAGIGYYRIDIHPSTGGNNYIDVEALPFQIPLGALIPLRMENLLPACKNIGTTHITNGCYRLHPVEWNVGEAAGALAAYCLKRKITPRAVYENVSERKDFQARLVGRGVELAWAENINLEEGDPHIHAK